MSTVRHRLLNRTTSKNSCLFESSLHRKIILIKLSFQTEEEVFDTDKESCKQRLGPQSDIPDAESSTSDAYDSTANDIPESNEIDLQKQQFIEKLQRLTNLKRKSDEFLQKNYYTDVTNTEKRPKVTDKTIYGKSNQLLQSSKIEKIRNLYEENAVEITTSLNPSMQKICTEKDISGDKNSLLPDSLELKTECDDSDIIVSDPAVCTTPKNYDNSREGKPVSLAPVEYHSPQESEYC